MLRSATPSSMNGERAGSSLGKARRSWESGRDRDR
jgi:hypothetical protein